MSKLLLVIVTAILLSACGSSVEGTYADEGGVFELRLESNGKGVLDGVGGPEEFQYKVDGDNLIITEKGGEKLDATFNNDGSIGFMGSKLIKKN